MAEVIAAPQPGDVWAVNTGNALTSELIRIGETLQGKPGLANHVVGVHHQDARGRWWGIEGRPGGVGWVDLATYQAEPWVRLGNANALQPRADAQRRMICAAAKSLLGTSYDWLGGIGADTLKAVGLGDISIALDQMWSWKPPSARAPGHVVCSSLYAWVYAKLGLPAPKGGEQCEPADWWAWNDANGWMAAQ